MEHIKKLQRLKIENGKHLTTEIHTVYKDYPLHWHHFFELELVLSGKGQYVVNDIEYNIENHNAFFFSTTDFHYLKVDEVTKVINISFDEESVDETDLGLLVCAETPRAYMLTKDTLERVKSAAELLKHECDTGGACQRQLLQYLLTSVLRHEGHQPLSIIKGEHYRGIKRAIVYMEMHFQERITLSLLAAEAGYHPTYFSELFKRVTGETYTDALTKLRVGYARTLLANGCSVSDSCFMSGFGSLSGFSAAFFKHCHMSPKAYQKIHHSKTVSFTEKLSSTK